MEQNESKPVIDFTGYIAERTINFTGREWVFQAINEWLADPDGSRFFLLTGEPGSGKTAISGRLSLFTKGTISPPKGLASLTPDFLSAIHFCSARDSRWINPYVFTESLAMQLAEHYPGYAKSLAEMSGERSIHIESHQQIGQGYGVGIIINKLDVSQVDPEDAFNRVVREPLEAIFRGEFDQQIVILVDALDEALSYTGMPNIVSLLAKLDNLPSSVRFIITSRPRIEVLRSLRLSKLREYSLTSKLGLWRSRDDIKQYVVESLNAFPQFATKLAENLPLKTFIEIVREKSDGNFLYVKYLLKMVIDQQENISLESLNALPVGLDGIYIEFLERLIGNEREAWDEKFAPILGTLAVAQQPLNEEQLAGIVEMDRSYVRRILTALLQFLDIDETLPESQRTYAIYHRSFSDFLLDKNRAQDYWCEAARAHDRIAKYFLITYSDDWLDCTDDYALRYTLIHLQEAVRQVDRLTQKTLHQKLVNSLDELQRDMEFSIAHWLNEQPKDYIGRRVIFAHLSYWLADLNQSYLLLIGEPGGGKTALAIQLVRVSRGEMADPNLTRGFLSAFHFCSIRNISWCDPLTFVQSIATQLSRQYPEYLQALKEVNDQSKTAKVHVITTGTPSPTIYVKMLIKSQVDLGFDSQEVFKRIILEPLQLLHKQGFTKPILILVDGLDEAVDYTGPVNIVTLLASITTLSIGVRFIFTSRDDIQKLRLLPLQSMSTLHLGRHTLEELFGYATKRLRNDEELAIRLGQIDSKQVKALIEAIILKSEGNIMYVQFLLDDIASGRRSPTEIDGLIEGLVE